MSKPIYPCLWFDGQARAAADLYCSLFKDSRIISETPLVVMFEINGKKIMGLNGGPMYKHTEAFSFVVECEDQKEIDFYWEKLTEGGEESMCGWLKDRFGVSWQIVPSVLLEMMSDPVKAEKAIAAFMPMRKLDIATLEKAVNP